MAATSTSGIQAATVVQGRGLALAEVGPSIWLWQAPGQAALAGWGDWFVGEVVRQSCPLVFGFRFRLEKVGNLTFVKKTVLQTRTYLFLEFFSAL